MWVRVHTHLRYLIFFLCVERPKDAEQINGHNSTGYMCCYYFIISDTSVALG